MADLSKLAINQITNDPVDTVQLVKLYSKLGVPSISVWRSKFEEQNLSTATFNKLIADYGIEVNGVCLCGNYGSEGIDRRQKQIDDNKKTIDFAAEIGAPPIVTIAGGLLPGNKDIDYARKFGMEALAEILEYARKAGVPLALEPLHPMYTADWSVVVSIEDANDWCDQLGDGIGIVVDVYHTWWDPNLKTEIERAGKSNRILAAHVNDWKMVTTDLLLDRGIMGEGIIDIPKIKGWLEGSGFEGRFEVEIFSNDYWAMDQGDYIKLIKEKFQEFV